MPLSLNNHEIILRLATAAILGAAVGLERERLEWAAGLRTHMLVCLGSCLVMIVSSFGFADSVGADHVVLDPSRVAAQVISGIGFLGAGTILFLRQKVIRGLTTAASLWTIAAVGLAVGGGLYVAAVSATVIALAILALVKPLEARLFRTRRHRRLTVSVDRERVAYDALERLLDAQGLRVLSMSMTRDGNGSMDRFVLTCSTAGGEVGDAIRALQTMDGVRDVKI